MIRCLSSLAAALVVLLATQAVAAVAKDGRREVRAAGVCGAGATSNLRLRSDGGGAGIDVRFEVDHARAGVVWRVVLVQERRVAWKGNATTTRPGGSFEVRRRLLDLPGADTVTANAWGPNGLVCRVAATLTGV